MLEWTVCKNCGKILDNSQNTCSSCDSDVDKIHMDYLAGYMTNLNFLVKTLGIFTPYCDSIRDLDNVTLESLIVDDLFKYFAYLGLGDDRITDNELEFINSLLDTSFTEEDILTLTDLKISREIPLSFKCLHELDLCGVNFDMTELNTANELYNCYKVFGKFFITVDNELNEDVFKLYNDYIANLENSLERENVELKPIKLIDTRSIEAA